MTEAKRLALAHRRAVAAHVKDMLDLERATAKQHRRAAEESGREIRRLTERMAALSLLDLPPDGPAV